LGQRVFPGRLRTPVPARLTECARPRAQQRESSRRCPKFTRTPAKAATDLRPMIPENFKPLVNWMLLRPRTGALRRQHRRTRLGEISEGLSRDGLV